MYIKVRVQPGAKKDELSMIDDTNFTATTKVKAERNLANKRVADLLAVYYKISPNKVRLVSGHRSQSKIFDIIS